MFGLSWKRHAQVDPKGKRAWVPQRINRKCFYLIPILILVCITVFKSEIQIKRIDQDRQIWTPFSVSYNETVPAWAKLEKVRWKREDDSNHLMLERKKLMQQLVEDDTIKKLWREEIDSLAPQGILMSAGSGEQLVNAFASMYSLRNAVRCKLPIVVCYWGKELKKSSIAFVKAHIEDVGFLDLSTFPIPSYHLPVFDGWWFPRDRNEGYMVKILALRAAPFKEVIYMDSDCIALQNPKVLLQEGQYQEHGSLFWPDFWRKGNQLWNQFGIDQLSPWADGDIDTFREKAQKKAHVNDLWKMKKLENISMVHRQAEAGEFLFNKEKHWDVLEWLLFVNLHHNVTYHIDGILGDKDTFSLAFALAGKANDYAQVDKGPAAALVDYRKNGKPEMVPRFRALGNIQLKPDGSMMFNHKTIDKIPSKGDPEHRVWPIDAVTSEVSDIQAGVLVNGGWEWQQGGYEGIYGFQWGFLNSEVEYFVCDFNCSCSVEKIHEIEKSCTGRSEQQKEIWEVAWPVTAVKVPEYHLARQATGILAEAATMLPHEGL